MTEDMSFGDWRDATPDKMRQWSEAKLYLCMELGGPQYEPRARAELGRRQNEKVSELVAALKISTDQVASGVLKLNTSSDKLETLTKRLNTLTVWLIILTTFAVAIPIGAEVWKAKHEVQVLPPPPPQP